MSTDRTRIPIRRDEVRKGDSVLYEWDEPMSATGEIGKILVAQIDTQWPPLAERAYLLDRPAPTVVVPESPTLGWATWGVGRYLAVWEKDGARLCAVDSEGGGHGVADYVTAFTEATAVPTEALDVLRSKRDCSGPVSCANDHVRTFLAAVDEASA